MHNQKYKFFISLFFIISFLLVSCTSHSIIKRKDFGNIKVYFGDNVEIITKDGKKLETKDYLLKNDTLNIVATTYKIKKHLNKKRRFKIKEKSVSKKALHSLSLDSINSVSYTNRLFGIIQGATIGFFGGIGSGIFLELLNEDRSCIPVVGMITFGAVAVASVVYGLAKGQETIYTFFDENDKFKYKKLRNKTESFFKIGIGSLNSIMAPEIWTT